jgi:hypothetical protein
MALMDKLLKMRCQLLTQIFYHHLKLFKNLHLPRYLLMLLHNSITLKYAVPVLTQAYKLKLVASKSEICLNYLRSMNIGNTQQIHIVREKNVKINRGWRSNNDYSKTVLNVKRRCHHSCRKIELVVNL